MPAEVVATSLLLLLDLALGGACVLAWGGAAVLAHRRRGTAAWLIGAGLLLVLGQLAAALVLAERAWGFAQEKLVFAVPVQLAAGIVAAAVAVPVLRAEHPPSGGVPVRVVAALVASATAAIVGLIARSVVGFPFPPVAAAVLGLLVPLAWWITAASLRQERRQLVGAAALASLLLASSVGSAWLADVAAPGALTAQSHGEEAPGAGGGTSVTDLRTPADAPGTVRRFELTAREEKVTSPAGRKLNAWSFGSLPGPELRVTVGNVVEATLRNEDVADGVTIHWHGYDVPNGEDGVAGATQDAVVPGESYTYRFVADEPGTYWYHTHQASYEGIRRGLFGMLVVLPREGVAEQLDITVPVHDFGSTVFLRGSDEKQVLEVAAGTSTRLRLVNTDQVPHRFRLGGASYRVVAVDGRAVAGGEMVRSRAVRVPAGSRVDVALVVPAEGVLLTTDVASAVSLALAPSGVDVEGVDGRGWPDLDLLSYGDRGDLAVPGGVVEAGMVLDRQPRFFRGLPANAYTVDGAVFPHIPSIQVTEGDVVRLTVVNRGWETHPMHIHGHHVLVLSRNGVDATGAPLWLDSFDVQPGEVWQVMLVADNPGIWMDHCHNLDHAEQGMLMALTYRGVTTPFDHRQISG